MSWRGESYRHSMSAHGLRTARGAVLPREKTINVNGFVNVDYSIAGTLQTLNSFGFHTIQSCSGVKADHPNNGCEHTNGYIAFFKKDLSSQQIHKLGKAAQAANLALIIDPDDVGIGSGHGLGLFFTPGVYVRTSITKDGTTRKNIIRQANKLTDKEFGKRDETGTNWLGWMDYRDNKEKELIKQHGGWRFTTDTQVRNAWSKFEQELTKNV